MRNLTLWQAAAIALEAGAALAIAVLIGLVVGRAVDDRLGGATPVFMIVGALVGLCAGVYSFVRVVQLTLPRRD